MHVHGQTQNSEGMGTQDVGILMAQIPLAKMRKETESCQSPVSTFHGFAWAQGSQGRQGRLFRTARNCHMGQVSSHLTLWPSLWSRLRNPPQCLCVGLALSPPPFHIMFISTFTNV